MAKDNLVKIGGELKSIAADGIVADAAAVKDYNKNKTQQTINSELTASVENISRSVPSSGNVVKIESQQGNSVLVLKNEDGTEVSTIVGVADRYSGWEQGGDTRIPTIELVKEKLAAIDVSSQIGDKANKSEMSIVAGTGANADKTTITLKSGTSAIVLTQHQDVSEKEDKSNKVTSFSSPTDTQYPSAKLVNDQLATKQNTISNVTVAVDANTGTPAGTVTFNNNTLAFDFQNLKGAKGDTGERGIQGVQGERGPKGDTGITGDASSLAVIHGVDTTTSYTATDVAGADAVQDILKMLGKVYYVTTT